MGEHKNREPLNPEDIALRESARRSMQEQESYNQFIAGLLQSIPGEQCERIITAELKDSMGNGIVKQMFLLSAGPVVINFDPEQAIEVGERLIEYGNNAKSKLQIVGGGNGSGVPATPQGS